ARCRTAAVPCRPGSTCPRRSAGTSSPTSAASRVAPRSNGLPAAVLRRPAESRSAGRYHFAVRLATIDLGSNTVRYLLVEVNGDATWRTLDHDQRVTRLGQGLAASGRLGEAPMARTGAAVVEYVERARRLGADDVLVVATSAVREAANGREFAVALERAS